MVGKLDRRGVHAVLCRYVNRGQDVINPVLRAASGNMIHYADHNFNPSTDPQPAYVRPHDLRIGKTPKQLPVHGSGSLLHLFL